MVINVGKSAVGLVNNKADKGFVSLAGGLGLHLGAMESQEDVQPMDGMVIRERS